MLEHISKCEIKSVDRFNYMLNRQTEFTKKVIRKKFGKELEELTWEEKQEFMKDLVLHITDECFEFLREINWKMHRKNDKPFNEFNATKELVDISKFLLNFLIILGIDDKRFFNVWVEKTNIVEEIWKKEHGDK